MADVTWRRDAGGLVSLLCRGVRHVAWCFADDEDEMLAALLPPLPSGALLDIRTLPADGDAHTGGRVWHSAPVMCRWLATLAAQIRGASVIELGCGTGACGIFCAALGASRVVLTDGGAEPLLELAARNLRVARATDAQVASCAAEVQRLGWGCEERLVPASGFHWIIGSDVIYDPAVHADLCRTLQTLLRRRSGRRVGADGAACASPTLADRPRAVLSTMPRGCVVETVASEKCYAELALHRFTSTAAQHALRVTAVRGSTAAPPPTVGGVAFRWVPAEFCAAEPFLFEVSLDDHDEAEREPR